MEMPSAVRCNPNFITQLHTQLHAQLHTQLHTQHPPSSQPIANSPPTMSRPKTLMVSLDDLAQMIDHSLLHPTMTDSDVEAGLQISKKYGVATGKPHLTSPHSSQSQAHAQAHIPPQHA